MRGGVEDRKGGAAVGAVRRQTRSGDDRAVVLELLRHQSCYPRRTELSSEMRSSRP